MHALPRPASVTRKTGLTEGGDLVSLGPLVTLRGRGPRLTHHERAL